jgi:cell division protease FtsH
MKSQNKNEEPDKLLRLGPLLIWLLILSGLLIWNGFAFWPKAPSQASITYSEFIEQLNTDNVKRVYIDGDKITGAFEIPILWPPEGDEEDQVADEPKISFFSKQTDPAEYKEFSTVFPQEIGDSNLLPLLEKHGVTVEVKSITSNRFFTLILSWLPLILLFIFFIWMSSNITGGRNGAFRFGKSRPRRYSGDETKVTFDDVAGVEEAKAQLLQEVDFLRNPKKYHEIGARIPRGVLLMGPPGTGKTLLAKAVAGEASVPFFSISASEFVEMFVGVGASRVRDLFKQAKESAPSILFIDELDAVARRRGAGMGTVNDEREQTLNQLLVAMDGFDEREEVIVLAATNRPDVLDPALLRPGRFDRQVVLGLPDLIGREGILKIHTRKLKLKSDVDIKLLARPTTGMSGADLANLCNEAALVAARDNHREVTKSDFEEALDKIRLGEKRQILLDQNQKRVIAYHEAGHAIVAWFTPDADEVQKVTIIPRGQALGMTEQLPGQEQYNYSLSYLVARIEVMLGGRTAEELALGEITTGAENDLVEATRLARRMVTRWGMGELGLAAFSADEEHPFLGYELARGKDYSEETASFIDREVRRLLDASHTKVFDLLSSKKDNLNCLAQALLERETIDKEELIKIIGARPGSQILQKVTEAET